MTVAAIAGSLPEGTASTPVAFTVTLAAPTNVQAIVNGTTSSIMCNPVATATAYHVVITQNGNPYLDVT